MSVPSQLFVNHYDPNGNTGNFSLQYNIICKVYDKNGMRLFRRITLSNHWKKAYCDGTYVFSSSITNDDEITEGEILFYGNDS